jgi:hypothetical protein
VRATSEGLRHEVGKSIRTTLIPPGAVDSELKFGSSHKESSEGVQQFYRQARSRPIRWHARSSMRFSLAILHLYRRLYIECWSAARPLLRACAAPIGHPSTRLLAQSEQLFLKTG